MTCRKLNVSDFMATDIRSLTETFSNENSKDSGYWSDYPEISKLDEKNENPSESLCKTCYADCQNVSVFFQK